MTVRNRGLDAEPTSGRLEGNFNWPINRERENLHGGSRTCYLHRRKPQDEVDSKPNSTAMLRRT